VGGGTFNINDFLGADRYYTNSTPIDGQNTVAVNLEAGHVWNGHETLQHVTTFYNAAGTWGGGMVAPLYDRHATWAAMFIGGRQTTNSPTIAQQGLAPGTDLRSAAVATNWSGSAYALNFGISANSYITAYGNSFAVADVVNSSYGYGDAGGVNVFTIFTDAMSFQSSETLHVVSAGNSGPSANTVGAPGSGYNTLTVAALGSANNFDTVASFSSRGPQNFAYLDYATGGATVTVAGVRAAVDIAAPGESLTSAFYGGQTGGNNTSLAGSSNGGTNADAYATVAGTSFSSPIVAGGAALAYSAAKTLPTLATNAEATQNMVVKSLLLTGADKTSGWSNGQTTSNGVVTTTQSLDWAVGAGRMNLDRTFDIQVNGQRGVDGIAVGAQGAVLGVGWDFGAAQLGVNNDYAISDVLLGGSTFTTSLSWMRVREYFDGSVDDYAQADLNISLWSLGSDNSFQSKVAESVSLYNTVEHLSFALPATGTYGLRVSYLGNTFDNTGALWGTTNYLQGYGLSWDGDVVAAVYWNPSGTNNVWDGSTSDFNTASGGGGSSTAATTTNTEVVFAGGTNPSSTVVVSGSRGASGLVISNGNFNFVGTNAASITVGEKGIVNSASATGPTTFGSSVGVVLGAGQTWSNAASNSLSVQGAVTGAGDLALRSSAGGSIILSGLVNHSGALTNSGTGAGTNNVSGAIGSNVTGVTQDSATSKLILAGSNTYTGNTVVAEGELVVNGNIASSALTSVQNGGTLSGSGTLGDTIILSGGTGSPGSSPGTQTIAGDFAWSGGGNYNWQIHDAAGAAGQLLGWDLYDVSGVLDLSALTIGSKFNINLWSLSGINPDANGNAANFDALQNYTWTIVATDLGIVGFNPESFNIVTVANNGTGGFSNDLLGGGFGLRVTGNNLELTFTAVPEPGTWVAAAVLAAVAFGRWRSRRQC
jgi:hypothetical protein